VRVIDQIGIPVGRPQTVAVDLSGKFLSPSREVRITTSMRVYWDQILADTSGTAASVALPAAGSFSPMPASTYVDAQRTFGTRDSQRTTTPDSPQHERILGLEGLSVVRLDAVQADLRWRGFSKEISPDGRKPLVYDYDQVSPVMPWKQMAGRYTREGDVRELLAHIDDRFVVSRPGDELAIAFDAAALPPLAAGERRTLLLYAHGYSKEMNPRSASPDATEPLPFGAMSSYPYPPSESYPDTPVHRAYRERYNSRGVSRTLPPLERSVPDQPPD
jgi:hypothetical protein